MTFGRENEADQAESHAMLDHFVAAGGNFNQVSTWLGAVAVTCATINTVGGFLITDRMLKMFKKRAPLRQAQGQPK